MLSHFIFLLFLIATDKLSVAKILKYMEKRSFMRKNIFFYLIGLVFSISITADEIKIEEKIYNYLLQEVNSKENAKNIYTDIMRFSQKYNVDPGLITAVMKIESNFIQESISVKGATGLMQLMPETAEQLKINPFSQEENIKGGILYLKNCLSRNGNDIPLALAAYNTGQGNLNKYDSVPPFQETQEYITKVLDIYKTYFNPTYEDNKLLFEPDTNLSF